MSRLLAALDRVLAHPVTAGLLLLALIVFADTYSGV